MKKQLALCLCIGLTFTITGCSPGTLLDQFLPADEEPAQNQEEHQPRVYMDEIRGNLQDFTGNQLTIKADDNMYVFDVSQATLECEDGMITGDEISIIYEGQLSDTDTSTVRALKVVDEYHKKSQLEDRTAHGQVQDLTANTITIKAKSGKTATYPITGTEQYYQNGIKANNWVYLHFKGKFPETESDNPTVLNASHLKVLSISDIDPLKVPDPTPTPTPSADETQTAEEKKLSGIIQDIKLNSLTVLLDGMETPLVFDMSSIPCHFAGGPCPGSHATVTYTGEFNGATLDGISVLGITGEDPDTLNNKQVSFTVTGEIMGSTANTVTILTFDGAAVTFRTDNARNSSTGGLLSGSSVKITFHPAQSRESNIYVGLKIEDA
ncbi:MAG: hypothetical protein Q4C91_07155 [Eubacteriales bacterium]|nr:hypothetical protein [Eubacteriales bacterium]